MAGGDSRDADGAVTARDKIATSRIATVGENQDGYGEEAVIEPNNQTDQVISDGEKPPIPIRSLATSTEPGNQNRERRATGKKLSGRTKTART